MRRCHSSFGLRRGFTYVELIIGMVVTALVCGALGALMSAVAQGWTASDQSEATANTMMQAQLRVRRVIKSARQLGATRTGAIDGTASQGAAVLMWKGDVDLDGNMDFSELALLEHEVGATPASCKIVLYEVSYPANWTPAQKQTADSPAMNQTEIYSDASIDAFKTLAHVYPTVLARNVIGAEFHLYDGASVTRPAFDYLLNFQSGSTTAIEYGTATVRTPTTRPSGV